MTEGNGATTPTSVTEGNGATTPISATEANGASTTTSLSSLVIVLTSLYTLLVLFY